MRLVPLDDAHRDAVFGAEMANFADEKVRVGEWAAAEGSSRALCEFGPAFRREVSGAAARGDRLWSAVDDRDRFVGWRMYGAAGYEVVDEDERRSRLRKRLRT